MLTKTAQKIINYIFLLPLVFIALSPIINAQKNSQFNQEIYPITECNDGVDNDGDGGIDFATDPDCTSWIDEREKTDPKPDEPNQPTDQNPNSNQTTKNNSQQREEKKDSNNSIAGKIQEFIGEPLGQVLGKEGVDANEISKVVPYKNNSFIIIIAVYLLLNVITLIYFIKLEINNNDDKNA